MYRSGPIGTIPSVPVVAHPLLKQVMTIITGMANFLFMIVQIDYVANEVLSNILTIFEE